ncbi:MAG: hypothetical protein A2W00_14075 [Candidatus Eisenbacteria bacterium RBG_16_71_46]|nr:MAG: hypothetical protein A2W00_14075 [Candidatus Eisenbacteria bacterium RBG_16_71_46]
MNFSWPRVTTIARREFLATVRRKAFVFTAIGTPAYFAFVMFLSVGPQVKETVKVLESFKSLGVVDSSGLFGTARPTIDSSIRFDENPFSKDVSVQEFRTEVRFFASEAAAESALRALEITQVLVIPADYLETGRLRRYARTSSLFSGADRRAISTWLVQGLVEPRAGTVTAARAARPTADVALYTLDSEGQFELKDDRRELVDLLLPLAFAMLLGMTITVGGQYLLQGVAEEKESRIMESLLCTVSSEELLGGKLIGLGSAGLLLIVLWAAMGLPFVGTAGMVMNLRLPPSLLALVVAYFLLGYLFYASLMTGIGSVASSMREAQQFSVWFTFANFAPLIMLALILSNPGSPLAVGLSLFPVTAGTTMMLRLTASTPTVTGLQLALSLSLLAASAVLALVASARVFRIGLLMYGKTPRLPEILRWARRG